MDSPVALDAGTHLCSHNARFKNATTWSSSGVLQSMQNVLQIHQTTPPSCSHSVLLQTWAMFITSRTSMFQMIG